EKKFLMDIEEVNRYSRRIELVQMNPETPLIGDGISGYKKKRRNRRWVIAATILAIIAIVVIIVIVNNTDQQKQQQQSTNEHDNWDNFDDNTAVNTEDWDEQKQEDQDT
ncbi:unnamed protein product, partial [marine sediment metagenome]